MYTLVVIDMLTVGTRVPGVSMPINLARTCTGMQRQSYSSAGMHMIRPLAHMMSPQSSLIHLSGGRTPNPRRQALAEWMFEMLGIRNLYPKQLC